ncbi:MAG TPA: hypothetical protein VID25_11680 [Candidatus Limnocylindrales bacterium]|jgi:hypothetical protein
MSTVRPGVIDLVEDLAFSLVAITTSAIGEASEGLEPTFRQWRLVVLLGRSTEGLRLQDIAAVIGASAPPPAGSSGAFRRAGWSPCHGTSSTAVASASR